MDERDRRWLAEPPQRRERMVLIVGIGIVLAVLLVAAFFWLQLG